MKQYIPSYYRNFQCIAQKCKDNCCIGWDIMIDQQSYEQYQKVATPFKKRLDVYKRQDETTYIDIVSIWTICWRNYY